MTAGLDPPFEVESIDQRSVESGLNKKFRDYIFLLSMGLSIVALDQVSKALVRTMLPFQQVWSPWDWLTPYARIVNWKNTGAAFGMLQDFNVVFATLAVLVSLAILYYFPQVPAEDWPLRVAMGLQLGGAVGNLIDRLTYGYVTDFISVGTFPVFNVADSSISIGVAVLIVGMWIKERRPVKVEMPAEAPDPAAAAEETPGE